MQSSGAIAIMRPGGMPVSTLSMLLSKCDRLGIKIHSHFLVFSSSEAENDIFHVPQD